MSWRPWKRLHVPWRNPLETPPCFLRITCLVWLVSTSPLPFLATEGTRLLPVISGIAYTCRTVRMTGYLSGQGACIGSRFIPGFPTKFQEEAWLTAFLCRGRTATRRGFPFNLFREK